MSEEKPLTNNDAWERYLREPWPVKKEQLDNSGVYVDFDKDAEQLVLTKKGGKSEIRLDMDSLAILITYASNAYGMENLLEYRDFVKDLWPDCELRIEQLLHAAFDRALADLTAELPAWIKNGSKPSGS